MEETGGTENDAQGAGRRAALLLAGFCLVSLAARTAAALRTDILPDEAIYWWGAVRGLVFSPHPPLVSLLIRAGEQVAGHGMLGLRLSSLVLGTLLIPAAYVLGAALFDRRAGLWAAGFTAAAPFTVAMGLLATPDVPQVLLWLVFVYCAWRGLQEGRLWWTAAGVVLALGLYTKYMMVLAVPALALALLATPAGRRALRTSGPWLAVGLGAALFAPAFLAWNARHGWPALDFHLESRHAWILFPERWDAYVFGHAGLISPALWVACIAALVVAVLRRRQDRWAWVAAFGLVPILFFMVPSLFTERHMLREHWDAIGYVVAIVGVGGLIAERAGARGRAPWWAPVSAGVALVLTAVVLAGTLWPALAVHAGFRPPADKMMGWRGLAEVVRTELERPGAEGAVVVGDSWRSTLCVGYYLADQYDFYALPHRRNDHYGVTGLLSAWGMDWPHLRAAHAGGDAVHVDERRRRARPGRPDVPLEAHRAFEEVLPAADHDVVCAGLSVARFGIYRARGLRTELRSEEWVRENRPHLWEASVPD